MTTKQTVKLLWPFMEPPPPPGMALLISNQRVGTIVAVGGDWIVMEFDSVVES